MAWANWSTYNGLLTKLNSKRAGTIPAFSTIILTDFAQGEWIQQAHINALRAGVEEILTYYGYTDLAEALTHLGYGTTWYKDLTLEGYEWICQRNIDEIDDILNSMQTSSYSPQTTTTRGTSSSPYTRPTVAEACASARASGYKSTNQTTWFGGSVGAYWNYGGNPPDVWYWAVALRRPFIRNISMPVSKIDIGKIFFTVRAKRYHLGQTQYSNLDFYAGNYNPVTYEDDVDLFTETGLLIVSCPLDDTIHTHELNVTNTINSFNSIQLVTSVPLCPLEISTSGYPPPDILPEAETLRFLDWSVSVFYHT